MYFPKNSTEICKQQPIPPNHGPNTSSSSSLSSKVNVSNVFSSLNDYMNAGLDTSFQKMTVCDESLPPTTLAPPPPTAASQIAVKNVDSSPSSDSLKVVPQMINHHNQQHHHHQHKKHKQPRAAGTFYSNSSSPDSSRSSSASSSRRTPSTSSSTTTDDEEDLDRRLDPIETKQLIPSRNKPDEEDDEEEEENGQESMNVISDIRTNSTNPVNNKTMTIFSSSSSYCYNENASTDVTFSNDIVSLNETSSLSSLVNISNNNETGGDVPIVNNFDDDSAALDGKSDEESTINSTTNKHDDDIVTIDRSSVLLKDKNEVRPSEDCCGGDGEIVEEDEGRNFNDFETRVIENVAPPVVMQVKPVGFESTMDDVSDTELESYLQELEFEPNSGSNPAHSSLPPIVDEGEASQANVSSDVSPSEGVILPAEGTEVMSVEKNLQPEVSLVLIFTYFSI